MCLSSLFKIYLKATFQNNWKVDIPMSIKQELLKTSCFDCVSRTQKAYPSAVGKQVSRKKKESEHFIVFCSVQSRFLMDKLTHGGTCYTDVQSRKQRNLCIFFQHLSFGFSVNCCLIYVLGCNEMIGELTYDFTNLGVV